MAAIRLCVLAVTMLPLAACASRHAGGNAAGGVPRWSGSFKQMAASAVIGSEMVRARASGYGTITLTPLEDQKGRTKVEVSINTSLAGTQIAWALFPGPCNSPSPPVIAVNEFPTIDVANSGSGIVRAELQMALDPRATYHANVYWSSRATDVSNVMLCANLTFSGAR